MLTNNTDVSDGLTKGAMGTITHVVSHDGSTAILVKFDNSMLDRHKREQQIEMHNCIQHPN